MKGCSSICLTGGKKIIPYHNNSFPQSGNQPFFDQKPILGTYSNSADPGQMLQNAASDQGLYCLLTGISIQNSV